MPPYYFTTTYRDRHSGALVQTILPPTLRRTSALARAKVQAARLALEDARVYYEAFERRSRPCAGLTRLRRAHQQVDFSLSCSPIGATDAGKTPRLLAPTPGTVTSLNAAVGQSVGTAPVVVIASDALFVHFYVEETDIALMSTGLPVRVVFDAYPDDVFTGTVTRIDPELASISGTNYLSAWATVELPAGKTFLNGMTAEVEVVAGESLSTIIVPAQAVRELALGSYAGLCRPAGWHAQTDSGQNWLA